MKILVELTVVPRLQVGDFAREITVGEGEPSEMHKSAHNFDGDLSGPFALEDVRSHQGTVFGEGVGKLPDTAVIA